VKVARSRDASDRCWPKSRTKRHRNTKIGGKVTHPTYNNAYKFQGQRSKVKVTWSITLHNNMNSSKVNKISASSLLTSFYSLNIFAEINK